jgi:NitT/TauT family transport system substrate-binding protein
MMTDMIVQSLVNNSSAEDGMKTVAMAFGGDASEGRFIVASSPDSGISEPGQLAGSKIGISENTMMEYLVGRYLEDLGVDLSSVEMVNIPKLTLRLDLLMEGSDIQAAILPDPLAIEAESRGCGTVIDDTKLGKNYSQSVVTLRKTLIEDGAGTLDAFRDAYNEAIERINADPDACLDLFYEKANVAEPLRGKYAVPSYTPHCVPTQEDVAKIEDFMVKKGLLDKPFSYEEMVATDGE